MAALGVPAYAITRPTMTALWTSLRIIILLASYASPRAGAWRTARRVGSRVRSTSDVGVDEDCAWGTLFAAWEGRCGFAISESKTTTP